MLGGVAILSFGRSKAYSEGLLVVLLFRIVGVILIERGRTRTAGGSQVQGCASRSGSDVFGALDLSGAFSELQPLWCHARKCHPPYLHEIGQALPNKRATKPRFDSLINLVFPE